MFHGDNGQGKTNLLETIYVVGALRSFRTQRMSDIIGFEADRAYIGARIQRGGLERVYELVQKQRGRQVRLDGKAVRPISKYFGDFNVVLFAPEDLQVPRGSPATRRRFLDRAVFNRNPGYLPQAQAYDKVVRSRNALLREVSSGKRTLRQVGDLLAVFGDKLAAVGAEIIYRRSRYLAEMRPRFRTAFESITQTGLVVDTVYESHFDSVLRAVWGTDGLDHHQRDTDAHSDASEPTSVDNGSDAAIDPALKSDRDDIAATEAEEEETSGHGDVDDDPDVESGVDGDPRFEVQRIAEISADASSSSSQPSALALTHQVIDTLRAALADLLREHQGRDLARGVTSVGPHRDDLSFRLNGHPAAAFASQGQLRAMVLAWKTAEMEMLAEQHGEEPVLLLDDVSSELDPTRNEYLFEFLKKRPAQCFITTTHPDYVLLSEERSDYAVSGGVVRPQNPLK